MPLSHVEERLCRSIAARESELVRDLARLVAIPTGHNHAPGLDESRGVICDRLARLGARVRSVPGDPKPAALDPAGDSHAGIPPTVVCEKMPGESAGVLLAGHLDTVHDPRGAFQTLAIAPDSKTAVGPGCMDMKGGILIAIAALEALAEAGVSFPWAFCLNSDEETGSFHSNRALRAEATRHRVGLVFEPALPDGGLVIERAGSGRFHLRANGVSAHAGRDFAKGVSAISALAERVVRCAAMSDTSRGKTVNVGVMQGGTTINTVPDEAHAWGDVRYASPEVQAELAREIQELATPTGAIPGIEARIEFSRPAKPITPAVERLAHLARQVSEDLGRPMPFGKTGGVCDGNNLQAQGLPTIDTLGVRGGAAHTPREWIELASLVDRAQLAAILLSRLAASSFAGF